MSTQKSIIRAKKNKAQELFQQNRLAEARELYQQICQLDRLDAEAWFTLGALNGLLGHMEESISCNQTAITIFPKYAEAYFNLAKAQQALGRLDQAQQSYRQALTLKPQWPEALSNLGNVLHEQGMQRDAEECYRQILALHGDSVQALLNLGNLLREQGRPGEAAGYYRRAVSINPKHAIAQKHLGGIYQALGKLEDALVCYRNAAQLDSADLGVIAAQAAVLERQGSTEEAYTLIKPYVESGIANLGIANVFSALCDKLGLCDQAIELLEQGLSVGAATMGRDQRVVAHFNLGRLYDRAQQYGQAFAHFKAGNELKPYDFNSDQFVGFVDALIDTFDANFLRNAPRATHGSQRPIFIVGMPRSGTSLVEQILASHPQVYGGGELDDIKELAFSIDASYPQGVRELTVDGCNRLAARYLKKLDELSPDTRYVTDKMPQNFLALGLIAMLFPEAHIIHCQRDPMDTCLSCYFHDFTGHHPYIYRLESLGLYYRQYQRLMDHWRTVLSKPMLEISYEALVQEQERYTRELLEFCDLPWEEACLRFHENARIVHTSSYQQVRKPIYRNAMARWRNYEPYLEPLKIALN